MTAERHQLANMSVEDQFKAAVNIIQSLPKNGHFQPSNDLKLKFYGFYKQATEGPNTTSKPAFYDIVAKAKWDAWKKLDSMSKEQAMKGYLSHVKIVETMSYTEEIADFYDVLGPFYEIVYESNPKKKEIKMNGGAPSNGVGNGSDYNYNHKNISGKNMMCVTFMTVTTSTEYTTFNGIENGGDSDAESDGDEFSDTFDHIGNARGEAENSSRRIAASGIASRPSSSRSHLNRGATNAAFNDLNLAAAISGGGAGGGGSNGQQYIVSSAIDINEQMALAILRLQQSLDQINNRITVMETRINSTSTSSLSVSKVY
ncbi:acyl-CoA-binding domain-containing protein 5A-like protein [Leptotrombidium deliense]|uniref:Acyl-CoA-binding domain-containing protein 5A-like protein n=1 Tax=Leptotrombidium deliense TaxID=299467 RepID=A0A443SUJ1_9ACAR|nr:acyl-CoA-binding domain-containing protein 5A-like protein [Leptotrombidium deliense]